MRERREVLKRLLHLRYLVRLAQGIGRLLLARFGLLPHLGDHVLGEPLVVGLQGDERRAVRFRERPGRLPLLEVAGEPVELPAQGPAQSLRGRMKYSI